MPHPRALTPAHPFRSPVTHRIAIAHTADTLEAWDFCRGVASYRPRSGIWGLRTLVFLGYYTRDDVAAFIGYRAHRDGWSARPESARERPSATPKDVGIIYKRPVA